MSDRFTLLLRLLVANRNASLLLPNYLFDEAHREIQLRQIFGNYEFGLRSTLCSVFTNRIFLSGRRTVKENAVGICGESIQWTLGGRNEITTKTDNAVVIVFFTAAYITP